MKIKIISVLIAAGFSCMPMSLVALAQADPPYKNFTEAHKEGVYHIKKGDPGYESRLNRDGDEHRLRTQASLDQVAICFQLGKCDVGVAADSRSQLLLTELVAA